MQHPPLVPMSWSPMQPIAWPRSKPRPEGAFLRPTSQPDLASSTHSQTRSNRPRTLSTGGMSYGKLPTGACGLIRSLRVSRLTNRHDTESNNADSARWSDVPITAVSVGRLSGSVCAAANGP